MVELPADVEQALRDLPENEWSALQARVRPPDPAEQVRAAVAQHVPESQLDGVMGIVKTSAFLTDDGQVDQAKISEHFGRLYGTQQPHQWGQTTGQPAGSGRVGDDARAALKKRHGIKRADTQPGASDRITRGAGGRAALAKRHGGAK